MKAHRARRDTSEAEIIDVLERRGFKVRKLAAKGLPDLLVWWPDSPKLFAIECKTGKGKLRATQDWASIGLRVSVLRSAEEAAIWNR